MSSHQQSLPHFNLLLPLSCLSQIWSSLSSISDPSVSSSDLWIHLYFFVVDPDSSPRGFSLCFLSHVLPFSCHTFWKFQPLCSTPLGIGVFIQTDTSAHIYLRTSVSPFSFVCLGNSPLCFIYETWYWCGGTFPEYPRLCFQILLVVTTYKPLLLPEC